VEKVELLACNAHFKGNSYFCDLGSKNLWIMFEVLNGIFQGQNVAKKLPNISTQFYTSRAFQQRKYHLNQILYEEVMHIAGWLTLLTTMILSECHINYHYSNM
jgi:hypothetical protein